MLTGKQSRVWGSVAVVLVVATINVVAFFGALRMGIIFHWLPTTQADLAPLEEASASGGARNESKLPKIWYNHVPVSARPPAADAYPVCVLASIGDDTTFPNDAALPYFLLRRLMDAAKEEISKVVSARVSTEGFEGPSGAGTQVKLLVGVDYPSVACKIARDSLLDPGPDLEGVEVELVCGTAKHVRHVTGQKPFFPRRGRRSVTCGTAIIGKSARYVQQLQVEWLQLLSWSELRIVDLDEQDPSSRPPALPREKWRTTVATTFSSNHFAVGSLLLRSIGRAGMEAAAAGQYNISLVVFALEDFNSTLQGIMDCLVQELNENYKVPTEVRRFDFSKHPNWMRINQTLGYNGGFGEYAWKVIMIHSLLVERGFILWADAGSRYNVEGMVESLNYTRDHGFATKGSSGFVPQYVHPGQMKYFRYQLKYGKNKAKNCDASGVGLTLDAYESVARPWYDCAITRQCIAPDGSHHGNHRQDQAALTLLADITGFGCRGVSGGLRRHMDTRPLDYRGTFPTHCYADPLQV